MGKFVEVYPAARHDYHNINNKWWWGETITFVHKDLPATVELLFEYAAPNVGYVSGLKVEESFRKIGLGSQMLSICEGTALAKGKRMMQLDVEKGEDWLLKWYEAKGYRILRINEHEYTMIKFLDPKDDR